MATEQEIHRVRHDLDEARAIAAALLSGYAEHMTDWETSFLSDLSSKKWKDALSYRQAEKLLQIRDGYHSVTHHRGLKLRRLVELCHEGRMDLSESSEEFIERLHAQRSDRVLSRDVPALLRCAHRLGQVESHMLISRPVIEIDEPRVVWDTPKPQELKPPPQNLGGGMGR